MAGPPSPSQSLSEDMCSEDRQIDVHVDQKILNEQSNLSCALDEEAKEPANALQAIEEHYELRSIEVLFTLRFLEQAEPSIAIFSIALMTGLNILYPTHWNKVYSGLIIPTFLFLFNCWELCALAKPQESSSPLAWMYNIINKLLYALQLCLLASMPDESKNQIIASLAIAGIHLLFWLVFLHLARTKSSSMIFSISPWNPVLILLLLLLIVGRQYSVNIHLLLCPLYAIVAISTLYSNIRENKRESENLDKDMVAIKKRAVLYSRWLNFCNSTVLLVLAFILAIIVDMIEKNSERAIVTTLLAICFSISLLTSIGLLYFCLQRADHLYQYIKSQYYLDKQQVSNVNKDKKKAESNPIFLLMKSPNFFFRDEVEIKLRLKMAASKKIAAKRLLEEVKFAPNTTKILRSQVKQKSGGQSPTIASRLLDSPKAISPSNSPSSSIKNRILHASSTKQSTLIKASTMTTPFRYKMRAALRTVKAIERQNMLVTKEIIREGEMNEKCEVQTKNVVSHVEEAKVDQVLCSVGPSAIYQPCLHGGICVECATKTFSLGQATCILCRQPITKIYKSEAVDGVLFKLVEDVTPKTSPFHK